MRSDCTVRVDSTLNTYGEPSKTVQTLSIAHYSMPCAAGTACQHPFKLSPAAPHSTTHKCCGNCGGYLHGGMCGAIDPQSDHEEHRICPKLLISIMNFLGEELRCWNVVNWCALQIVAVSAVTLPDTTFVEHYSFTAAQETSPPVLVVSPFVII